METNIRLTLALQEEDQIGINVVDAATKDAASSAIAAANSAAASQESAQNAETNAAASASSAEKAAESASRAAASASNAEDSEGRAAESEANARNSATAASGSAKSASDSATDSSRSASASAKSASDAASSASAAGTSETNAKASETAAKTSETNAASSATAAATSEINAKTSETNAAKSAASAKASAESATTFKDAAATSAQNASNSANYAGENATRAESYAIGGTSSRSGEDTDNAKYYAQQAKKSAEIVAGSITGVSSFNNRTGTVTPASGDYKADQVTYDNTASGISANTVQSAIDKIAESDAKKAVKTDVDSALNLKANKTDVASSLSGKQDNLGIKSIGSNLTLSNGVLDAKGQITVDTALSTASTNPVQNKAVAAAINANTSQIAAVSEIISDHINNKSNPHAVTKAQVGLGSVANLDQSKAIKSITRSGTTFTATALDGTTTTFTQQDNNTTYGVATSSADGLMSKADKAKLDGIEAGSNVKSVNGKTGAVTLSKADVGLGNADNTSDADKPISTAVQEALDGKANNSVATSSLSGLMSAVDKAKLDGIGAGSNVKSVNGKTGAVTLSKADVGLGNVDNTSDADKPISTSVQEALDGKANNSVATSSADGLMSKADKAKLDGIGTGSNVKSVNGKTGAVTLAKGDVGLSSVANLDQSKAIKSITRSGTTFTATALDGTTTTFTQQDSNTTYGVATSSTDGLMSKTDKAKLDGISSGADASPIKTVKVNGTALTPDSNKAVNVTVPTLANNATTTAGGMALDARMGKTLADQASQLAKNTAQIETAGTATNAHSVGEYVMISNALYKVTASVAKGDTWTIGTNVAAANIGSEIGSLKSDVIALNSSISSLNSSLSEQAAHIRYGFPMATSVEICDTRAGGWMAGFIACNVAEGGVSTGYYKLEGGATATITWLNAGAITPTITVSNGKLVLSASKNIVSYTMLIV